MKELVEYRIKMIARLEEAAREFHSACEAVKDPFVKVEGEWTLHQVAAHVRDVEKLIFGARVEQTLNEDNPEVKNFDADEWMAAHYNPAESLAQILDEFTKNVADLCTTLRGLPQEAWSRESRHEALGGGLTMQLWVERSLAHIEEHLQAVKKV